MKRSLIVLVLLLLPALALDTMYIGETEGTDPDAVHKWETWQSDFNLTGNITSINPVYIKPDSGTVEWGFTQLFDTYPLLKTFTNAAGAIIFQTEVNSSGLFLTNLDMSKFMSFGWQDDIAVPYALISSTNKIRFFPDSVASGVYSIMLDMVDDIPKIIFEGNLGEIKNVTDPVLPQDVATKNYTDNNFLNSTQLSDTYVDEWEAWDSNLTVKGRINITNEYENETAEMGIYVWDVAGERFWITTSKDVTTLMGGQVGGSMVFEIDPQYNASANYIDGNANIHLVSANGTDYKVLQILSDYDNNKFTIKTSGAALVLDSDNALNVTPNSFFDKNVTADYFFGDGSQLTGIDANMNMTLLNDTFVNEWEIWNSPLTITPELDANITLTSEDNFGTNYPVINIGGGYGGILLQSDSTGQVTLYFNEDLTDQYGSISWSKPSDVFILGSTGNLSISSNDFIRLNPLTYVNFSYKNVTKVLNLEVIGNITGGSPVEILGDLIVYDSINTTNVFTDLLYENGQLLSDVYCTLIGCDITGNLTVYNITADHYFGSGYYLTNISLASNFTEINATLDTRYLKLDASNDPITENLELTKNVTADYFIGDGSQLTGILAGETNCTECDSRFIKRSGSMVYGNLHIGGQYLFNNTQDEFELEFSGSEDNYEIGLQLPQNATIDSATVTLTGEPYIATDEDQGDSSDDAHVDSGLPDSNFGNSQTLRFRGSNVYSLWKWDLSGIDSGLVISGAKFKYYYYNCGISGTAIGRVRRITSSWSEGSVTYNTAPSFDTLDLDTYSHACDSTPEYVTYDSTDLVGVVQSWINGTYTNYGVQVDSSSTSGLHYIRSKEYSSSVQRPDLLLSYSVYPSNVSIDVGVNGNNDYEGSGELTTPVNVDLNITAIQNYLDLCTADSDGNCIVPLKIHSDTMGNVTFSNLTVVWGANLYVGNVYADQYYGKNTSIASFDIYEDSQLVKGIKTKQDSKGNDYFEMPTEVFTDEYIDLGRVIGLLYGTMKEVIERQETYGTRIEILEAEVLNLEKQLEAIK